VKYAAAVVALVIFSTVGTQAQAGRWHIQTTSGDQPAQVATGKPVSFDATFLCNSGACGGLPLFLQDSTICDTIGFDNMSSGFVTNGSSAAFQIQISAGFGKTFIYTFIGTRAETFATISGVPFLETASATGSYSSTPGGCNNGLSSNQGTFVANWYPPLTGRYFGTLEPRNPTETPIGLELLVAQDDTGALTNKLITGRAVRNPRVGIVVEPVLSNCFRSTTLTVSQGPGKNTSDASGNTFKIFATDAVGNIIILEGTADIIGSNSHYTVSYEIIGGACNGQSGTGATFVVLSAAVTRVPQALSLENGLEPKYLNALRSRL